MPWFFRFILALNIAYCSFGLVLKHLPTWRMFEQIEPLEYTLTDSKNMPVHLQDYLPKGAYINTMKMLLPVVTFVCEHHRNRAPFVFKENFSKVRMEVGPVDCNAHI